MADSWCLLAERTSVIHQFARLHSLSEWWHWLLLLLVCALVVGIVIGLQIAGVVLMISLLVAPAAAARQWTRHLGPMVGLAAAIGAICSAGGALLSAVFSRLPTGPAIVVLVTLTFIASILFAPGRGLLFRRRYVVD